MNTQIEKYIDYLKYEKRLSNNTVLAYKNDLKMYSNYLDKNVLNASKNDVQDFLYKLNKDAKTKAHYLTVINSFYTFYIETGTISTNPASNIKMPKINKTIPNFLSIEEVDKLLTFSLDTHLDYRNKAMLEVMYSSGLRISELINLEINNIDFNEEIIRIYGKGKKERIVPINQTALKYLSLWLLEHRVFVIKNKINNYVFLNTFGDKMTRQAFFKIIKKRAVEANIKKNISPHTLRHSFATHLLNNGADIRIIQELLGHENLVTTEIYAHTQNKKIIDEYQVHPHAKKVDK